MTVSLRGIRVACFYPWLPFDPTGAWSRFTCLWKFLLQEGAEVTLAFFQKGNDAEIENLRVSYLGESSFDTNTPAIAQLLSSAGMISELKHYSSGELNLLLMYEKAVYLGSPKTAPWLEKIVGGHDIVLCEYPMYAPLLTEYCKKWSKPLVLTAHDVLYELHGQHPGAKRRLKQNEIHALGLADARVFCNDKERELFAESGMSGVTVLNTGDALSITPGDEEQSRREVSGELKLTAERYLLFVGSAHGPNIEAVAEIRRMAKEMPEMTFVVAGNCCAKSSEGNFVSAGLVSEQFLDRLYRGAFSVIVPLARGTGVSVKLFQGFVYGKAIVATTIGARGFGVTNDQELLIVSTPQEVPAGVRRLMKDEEFRQRIGSAARAFALTLDYRSYFSPYGEIIRNLTKKEPLASQPEAQQLVLVDNNLADRIGHHFNYALALKQECESQGVPFVALIKQSAPPDVKAELSGVGAFSQGIHEESLLNPFPPEWGNIRLIYDFLLSSDHFAKEMESALAHCARCEDTIFLPNATPRQILGLAVLLAKNPLYRTLKYVMVLRYSVTLASGPLLSRKGNLDKLNAERYQLAIEKLINADPNGVVRLATDSAELAEEFEAYSKRPLEVLPIPHTVPTPSKGAPAGIPTKTPQRLRAVYLGDAREEKGFELLLPLIRATAATSSSAQVEFVFQAFVSSIYHSRMAQLIDEMARLKLSNVHLIRSSLSAESYEALLESADLVLLPYDAVTYLARTSGPFVEAICSNKPVIVPRSSWMSSQLGNSQAGVTFISGNAQDFVRAFSAARVNIAKHRSSAEELGVRFRAFHNPRKFIKQLLEKR